jgi:hypothetical protein
MISYRPGLCNNIMRAKSRLHIGEKPKENGKERKQIPH